MTFSEYRHFQRGSAPLHSRRVAGAPRDRQHERLQHQRLQLEATIADFERRAIDLDREIEAEQTRARIHDPAHYAYPTCAKALLVRRDNLRQSAKELKDKLDSLQGN